MLFADLDGLGTCFAPVLTWESCHHHRVGSRCRKENLAGPIGILRTLTPPGFLARNIPHLHGEDTDFREHETVVPLQFDGGADAFTHGAVEQYTPAPISVPLGRPQALGRLDLNRVETRSDRAPERGDARILVVNLHLGSDGLSLEGRLDRSDALDGEELPRSEAVIAEHHRRSD